MRCSAIDVGLGKLDLLRPALRGRSGPLGRELREARGLARAPPNSLLRGKDVYWCDRRIESSRESRREFSLIC